MFVFDKALCLPALTDQRLCLLKMSRILVHKKHAEVDSLVRHKGFLLTEHFANKKIVFLYDVAVKKVRILPAKIPCEGSLE